LGETSLFSVTPFISHQRLDVSPKGDYAYVSGIGSDVITVIDLKKREAVSTIEVGQGPQGVRFSPDGEKAYVAVAVPDEVVVIDVKEHKVMNRIPVTGFPFWLAIQEK
jgi:YVTN family beta-propeller protein